MLYSMHHNSLIPRPLFFEGTRKRPGTHCTRLRRTAVEKSGVANRTCVKLSMVQQSGTWLLTWFSITGIWEMQETVFKVFLNIRWHLTLLPVGSISINLCVQHTCMRRSIPLVFVLRNYITFFVLYKWIMLWSKDCNVVLAANIVFTYTCIFVAWNLKSTNIPWKTHLAADTSAALPERVCIL